MTKEQLTEMRNKLNIYADDVQAVEDTTEQTEQLFNELWDFLDNAAANINELLLAGQPSRESGK